MANLAVSSSSSASAARHALLRRLGPALKHDMVVHLQAIAMMTEMLEARMDRGTLEQEALETSIIKLNRLARDGVNACLKVAGWIDPPADETVALGDGVQECVSLLASHFSFRGLGLRNEARKQEFEVNRDTLRTLLAGILLHIADTAQQPCDVVVWCDAEYDEAEISIAVAPREEPPGALAQTSPNPARSIDWPVVETLAQAEGVQLSRDDTGVRMRVRRAVATSPLRMVPY